MAKDGFEWIDEKRFADGTLPRTQAGPRTRLRLAVKSAFLLHRWR